MIGMDMSYSHFATQPARRRGGRRAREHAQPEDLHPDVCYLEKMNNLRGRHDSVLDKFI